MKHTFATRIAGASPRAGFTVLEMAVSALVLIMLSGALTQSLIRLRGVTEVSDLRTQLQDSGERALHLILTDLHRSGFVTIAGTSYPYLFNDGVATAPFLVHAHALATENAPAGDPDFGVNREIVVAQPLMVPGVVAGTDVPSLDANGNLLWSNTVISYVVITGADGVNYLQRRVNGANPRRIAAFVERITFDDAQGPGAGGTLPTGAVPIGAIRVRIWFRRLDDGGNVYRHSADVTVSLKNG